MEHSVEEILPVSSHFPILCSVFLIYIIWTCTSCSQTEGYVWEDEECYIPALQEHPTSLPLLWQILGWLNLLLAHGSICQMGEGWKVLSPCSWVLMTNVDIATSPCKRWCNLTLLASKVMDRSEWGGGTRLESRGEQEVLTQCGGREKLGISHSSPQWGFQEQIKLLSPASLCLTCETPFLLCWCHRPSSCH